MDRQAATDAVRAVVGRLPRRALAGAAGLLSVRLDVSAAGRVKRASELVNTLVATGGEDQAPSRASRALLAALARMRVHGGGSGSVVAPVHVLDGAAVVP